ncbi:prepilin-type N-terminal cleavage/methylation domain-containing protein [Aestuariivirga sp.]|jgi:prepilin-type N-terminal cleavage/methylation domain-containing protein|uniref:prepilin-type N-terminal cleavage/methylation domain-containing protein n=1 Tax=Aestuariivirga sp. TaxID=2650926 RepID=UPI003784BD31
MPMCAVADPARQAGFSLIEVLCALAIAAAAIISLSGGAAGSLNGARKLEMHLGARIILQSILEDELSAGKTAPALREGESGPYRWRLAISPATESTVARLPPEFRMYRLSASVMWGTGGSASASVLKLAR